MNRASKPAPSVTWTESAAEWYGAMVRGLEALEFLERSSEVAAEAVSATPAAAAGSEISLDEFPPASRGTGM